MYIKSQNGAIKQVLDNKKEYFVNLGWTETTDKTEIVLYNAKYGVNDNTTKVLIPFWQPHFWNKQTGYGNVVYSLFEEGLKENYVFHYDIKNPDYIFSALSPDQYKHLEVIKARYPEKKLFLHTMWESSLIPKDKANLINKYVDVLVLPCKWNKEVFQNSGVTVPVEIINYGVDDFFEYKEKTKSDVVKFLHYNSGNNRKGYSELIQAFYNEFTNKDKVTLTLKCQARNSAFIKNTMEAIEKYRKPNSPEVKVINTDMNRQELQELLYNHDCFVFPSKGEGFGLTPLEALVTGTYCIIPNKHGIAEYFDKKICLEIDTVKEQTDYLQKIYSDLDIEPRFWESPKIESIQKQMRHFYKNYDKLINKNVKEFKNVKETYNWQNTLKLVQKILKKYA